MSNPTSSPAAGAVRSRSLGRLALAALFSVPAAAQGLKPPPAPFENPITAEKAILGKILFWDEQLSSDGTMACGSCHQPGAGGADPRVGRHPGPDGVPFTADDILGSPGVVRSTPVGAYSPDQTFGMHVQVTGRIAPTNIGGAYFSTLRWDGRAIETYVDPQTNKVLIMFGGAMENHALGPPTSDAEMAYEQRDWHDIPAKIAAVRPLAHATNLPPDVVAALAANPDYGELMRRAYGDRTVTATRIIYALATYQRTLVPDRTPWDDYARGNRSALTANQQAGLALFRGAARCTTCHPDPLFSDGTFRNLGLRPVGEDLGWQLATQDPTDRGKFKVPTLRNAGLRNRYMHNGQLATLEQVVDFYDAGAGPFLDNKDPALKPIGLSPAQKAQLVDFVRNGLTDPRAQAELPPFDRPLLRAEQADPQFGAAHAGSGGYAPRALADAPLLLGNQDFRLGIADALGGAIAAVAFAGAKGPAGQSLGPIPIHIALVPIPTLVTVPLAGAGPGGGYGTLQVPVPTTTTLLGSTLYHQWFVIDGGAAGGLATTAGAGGTFF